MYVYLSKILPLFVLPPGVVLLLACFALGLRLAGRLRSSALVLSASLAILWLSSMPAMAAWLYGNLESAFPPEPLEQVPVSSCIIVLGGAIGLPMKPRRDLELAEAADRVYMAAQLYRGGYGGRVFVAAGNQPWTELGPSEAALIGELLSEWGVPPDAIQLEGRSRNTRENALNLKPMLEAAGCDRSLLVTSAAHMQRALGSFRKVGLFVYPVSTDVRVVSGNRYTLLGFLPDASALAMTSDALREWVGQRVYEWKGWN